MGYTSDVVFAVTKECWNKKSTPTLKKAVQDCDEVSEKLENYYFAWNCVKWYSDYPNVKAIEAFISDNPEETALIRIGEDRNDIEEVGDCFTFEIYTLRVIDMGHREQISKDDFFASNAEKFIKDIPEESE